MFDTDYEKGARDALSTFGIRLAADAFQRGVPSTAHEGAAEWLAKRLEGCDDATPAPARDPGPGSRLDRPVRWGAAHSLEGGSPRFESSGAPAYGGV